MTCRRASGAPTVGAMATGVHPATVAFSVRNVLAKGGNQTADEIWHALQSSWSKRVDAEEVEHALANLLEREMITIVDGPQGLFAAVDTRTYRRRPAQGRVEMEEKDPRAWEGWSP